MWGPKGMWPVFGWYEGDYESGVWLVPVGNTYDTVEWEHGPPTHWMPLHPPPTEDIDDDAWPLVRRGWGLPPKGPALR